MPPSGAVEVDSAQFRDRYLEPGLVASIVARTGMPEPVVWSKLATYVGEASIGVAVARRGLAPRQRILEVGAGLGFVSLFLHDGGHDITALEPIAAGFDFFTVAGEEIRRRARSTPPFLAISVEDLDPARHGLFDLIFSVNVLEHVPNFARAMDRMSAVLAPGGRMIHSCPNYWIPYEPHFGLPLLPFAPRLTARLLPAHIARSAVWRSLNFVTYGEMKRAAQRNRLEIAFAPALLAEALARLGSDRVFAERHGGIGRVAGALVRHGGLAKLVARLPPALSTPMLAELWSGAPDQPGGASTR